VFVRFHAASSGLTKIYQTPNGKFISNVIGVMMDQKLL
jgi:hypothetical protein